MHGHEEGDGHAHKEEEENLNFLWKGFLVLLGIYAFYLLELFLHTWPYSPWRGIGTLYNAKYRLD